MNIDKELIKKRFSKKFSNYEKEAIIQHKIAFELATYITKHFPKNTIKQALEIGIGTGFLSRELLNFYTETKWFLNDIAAEAFNWIPQNEFQINKIIGDAEIIDFPQNLDLIISSSSIQWFQDVQRFFEKSYNSLNTNGTLAFTTFGPDNFLEIRELLHIGLKYPSFKQLQDWTKEIGFKTCFAKEEHNHIFFKTPKDVLQHIKKTGVNAIPDVVLSRSNLNSFFKDYNIRYKNTEKLVQLTYHPISLILQK